MQDNNYNFHNNYGTKIIILIIVSAKAPPHFEVRMGGGGVKPPLALAWSFCASSRIIINPGYLLVVPVPHG